LRFANTSPPSRLRRGLSPPGCETCPAHKQNPGRRAPRACGWCLRLTRCFSNTDGFLINPCLLAPLPVLLHVQTAVMPESSMP
jgi:hypothetical protein